MSNVIIIGGGAAGMFAGIFAARNGHNVSIYEKNEKLGKKLFITGKGRCNLTNAGDNEELLNSVVTNKKFMYSSFNGFSNYDTMGFFSELGLEIKVERGNRVFPESNKSSDVLSCLGRELNKLNVKIIYNTAIIDVIAPNSCFKSVKTSKGQVVDGDYLIVATGGNSYQLTGSTGDGYKFAKTLGHKVTDILPALVPFNTKEEWIKELQGLSLRNVNVTVFDENKEIYSDFGELLFTHFGVSGPTVLSASSFVAKNIKSKQLKMVIDLKPALSFEQLDDRILRDFEEEKNKQYKNALDSLLPKKLIPVVIELSKIQENKKVNEISRDERQNLVRLIKNLEFTLLGLRGFNEAIITQGGVEVKEINPSTMESKLVKNVYFIGEVLDVDAVTGGFNLQVAWSTAYAAAQNIN
ncbi:BaiN/RdsA family NAD(P)/FAD-dependent oxidoreductase [[Clostridium] fimetarium]|uniref:NAD(P)/FAD-dependent oxidoreductase n=1 Tax=[Clostridium] fimetarium TaxID=99656 RepID=A0A1I0QPB3_9FIRM|nr:NAD(P)/FAD-dependent oxidoreductase [[Clostridium] fimetarium]SEW28654.1 hypothetical protein SAMN05421659_108168 [[Clostridium] fimetarium]